MAPFGLMHQSIDALRDSPPVRAFRRKAFDRRFVGNARGHLFRGVFDTFEAAEASAPKTLPTGYDNKASADLYLQRLRIDEYDYPAMFWIARALQEGAKSVIDLGGSVGIKYFAFGRSMVFPADLIWRVIEVPAAVDRGRLFADEHGVSHQLQFSHRLQDMDGVDVLYASGALQYLPKTLASMLAAMACKPKRIVVNTTPIHPSKAFFTLNSIGTAYCPYRVDSHEHFVDSVMAQGYMVRDQWLNRGKELLLPFEQGYSVEHYSGFCFDAVQA